MSFYIFIQMEFNFHIIISQFFHNFIITSVACAIGPQCEPIMK
jgi:hypothetical protein